jgi:hypothetical protein
MSEDATKREASRKDHLPFEARHIDELEWETIRWPGETGKMLFHPRAERPTEPNAGILRLEPGAHHPEHYHGFAQVWYIMSGEYEIDGTMYGPGTMLSSRSAFRGRVPHEDRRRNPYRPIPGSEYRRAADL